MQEQPRSDRDWEHWPGRRLPDDRVRHRLRSLFASTEHAAGDVEALIAERGRELETRTRQLADTVSDLERREETTRRLRIAVEEMLRRGSAELDERHAQLNALASELAERDARIAATEQEVEERRRELGAVELLRAAVGRREAAAQEREDALEAAARELGERRRELESRSAEVQARLSAAHELELELRAEREALDAGQATLAEAVDELENKVRQLTAAQAALAARERRVADLEERARELARAEPAPTAPAPRPHALAADTHLLLVPGDRYALAEAGGPPPEPGAVLRLGDASFRVLRVGPSPYPGDARRCAYLEPEPGPPHAP